jgi:formylglycine-generating enzyme required for sulfatase activity
LDSGQLLVVIITPESMASTNVEDEWQYYLDQDKPVIPILLKPAKMHFQLNRLQYVDFHEIGYEIALIHLHEELKRQGLTLTLPQIQSQATARHEIPPEVKPAQPKKRDTQPLRRVDPAQETDSPAPRPRTESPSKRATGELQAIRPRAGGSDANGRFWMVGAGAVVTTLIIIALVIITSNSGGDDDDNGDNPTATQAQVVIGDNTATDAPPPTNPPPVATIPPGYAGNPVTHNNEWSPVAQTFNGVEMVLVPAGCFTMGTTMIEFDYQEDEAPTTDICFDEPFWIDRYEVTNDLYGSAGTFDEPEQPRTNITWDTASGFCTARGASLPTEAQWEYAARGPDNLLYPWGNQFDGTRLNYCDANCIFDDYKDNEADDGYAHPAPVGSYPGGVSWVGAYDMAGNVWEWTSTIYRPYQYSATDGRENLSDIDSPRTLRGGTWNFVAGETRTTARAPHADGFPSSDWYGFRCAMDFDGG